MSSDLELLRAWKEGDQEAASQLIRRHFSSVYQFFRSKLDDQFDDLTQRTFTACLEQIDRFPEEVSFRAYVLGIARKQLLMHFRTNMRRNKRIQLLEVSAVELGASPSRVAALRQEEQVLLDALRQIPVDLQIAIELFYWEELTSAEIALILEIPHGTVRSRLRRARDALKEQIELMEVPDDLKHSTIQDLERWAESMRGRLGKDHD